jgi:Tfp pilus assembly protein FimT
MKRNPRTAGFCLGEVLCTMAVLALLCSVAFVTARPDHSRQKLEATSQRFQSAIDRSRLTARRRNQACGLRLNTQPSAGDAVNSEAGQGLLACDSGGHPLQVLVSNSGILVHTNLPRQLRFTANGLLIDGGLVVFSHPGTRQHRCVVLSLPLGVSRAGLYREEPAGKLSSQHCRPL